MKYYCETIPVTLAEKLKEKGMPYIEIDCETYDSGTEYQRDERWCNNTYAEVFDWLMDQGIDAEAYLSTTKYNYKDGNTNRIYAWCVHSTANLDELCGEEDRMSWHEAVNAAITKALELI